MIAIPLIIGAWRLELRVHPDRNFLAWLIDGMERGFAMDTTTAEEGVAEPAKICGRF